MTQITYLIHKLLRNYLGGTQITQDLLQVRSLRNYLLGFTQTTQKLLRLLRICLDITQEFVRLLRNHLECTSSYSTYELLILLRIYLGITQHLLSLLRPVVCTGNFGSIFVLFIANIILPQVADRAAVRAEKPQQHGCTKPPLLVLDNDRLGACRNSNYL